MRVRDILRLKGNALYTITPEDSLADAAQAMADRDIGSLVVMSHERVVGMLTFREVIQATVKNGGSLAGLSVYRSMDPGPLICTLETELDEVRRMMLMWCLGPMKTRPCSSTLRAKASFSLRKP